MPKAVRRRAYRHAKSQKLREMCSLWYSDGLDWYCAPFVHSQAVSGAEIGNGAHGTRDGRHRGWKEWGGPECQHMLLINRESMVIIRAGLWLLWMMYYYIHAAYLLGQVAQVAVVTLQRHSMLIFPSPSAWIGSTTSVPLSFQLCKTPDIRLCFYVLCSPPTKWNMLPFMILFAVFVLLYLMSSQSVYRSLQFTTDFHWNKNRWVVDRVTQRLQICWKFDRILSKIQNNFLDDTSIFN